MKATRALAFALALLLPAAAMAAGPKKLTLIFNGDNGGEIAPCG